MFRAARLVVVSVVVCTMCLSCSKASPPAPSRPTVRLRRVEGYPASVIRSVVNQRQTIGAAGSHLPQLYQIHSRSRTWPANHPVITVAFQGGSPALRNQIAHAVQPWTGAEAANVTFDFGPNNANGQFREWSNTDTNYAADIRIAFLSGDQGGYWSLVGNDSIKPSLVKPGEPSMNFEGFPEGLPTDWETTVLHEFGHALGFEHEHQSPNAPCETEFRWDDDQGYVQTRDLYQQFVPDPQGHRPGIYTVLGGPPNKWKPDQIDFNLRQLPQSTDWVLSNFDRTSIMKYQFDPWMFTHGDQSQCYSTENFVLSPQDIEAAKTTYPRTRTLIANALNTQIAANQQLLNLKTLPSQMLSEFKTNIDAAKRAKR